MCYIKSVCIIILLAFGLVDGYKCEKKNESYMRCSVYKIESQDECQTYLETNEGDGNFVFYIKPIFSGHLNISLYKRHSENSHTFIYGNLFTEIMDNDNQWYKIKIRRNKGRQTLLNLHITYYLEVNDLQRAGITFIIPSMVGAGNEIRVNTVTSLWSFTCNPSLYHHPKLQPTTSSQHLVLPHKSAQPKVFLSAEDLPIKLSQPSRPPYPQSTTTDNKTISVLLSAENLLSRLRKGYSAEEYPSLSLPSEEPLTLIQLGIKPLSPTGPTTVHVFSSQPASSVPPSIQTPSPEQLPLVQKINTSIPVWQLAIIASTILVLTLVIILVSVFLFVRLKQKNSDPVMIQPKKRLSARLSRQVSKILGYSTILDHNYEEVNLNSPGEPKHLTEE